MLDQVDVLGWPPLLKGLGDPTFSFYKIINGLAHVTFEGVLVEVYKGTRRKHNMKFRQIGHTTSKYVISYTDTVWYCCHFNLIEQYIFYLESLCRKQVFSLCRGCITLLKVSKKSATDIVTLVTFFSRTLLLHIKNYAGYLWITYDPNQYVFAMFQSKQLYSQYLNTLPGFRVENPPHPISVPKVINFITIKDLDNTPSPSSNTPPRLRRTTLTLPSPYTADKIVSIPHQLCTLSEHRVSLFLRMFYPCQDG